MNKKVLFRLFALIAAMMCALVMQAAESYGPLLTAKWNQKEPFWNQCQFTYNGTNYQCLTGPNATAAAMILYYWKYPAAQVDTIPSYTADLYISLFSSINFNYPTLQATTFDWENMIDDYSGDYTSAQADAVAMLIHYVGQAQKTHYGVNAAGSGINLTDIPNIVDMFTLFGYDPGLCRLVEKSNYSESAWASLIQGELAAGRPVLYMALNTEIGCLIFDVDGYNATNDQYHVNFGFGGDGDGWFAINSITLDGYTFNQSQQAIVGIQPLTEQPCEPYASLSTDGTTLTFYYDSQRYNREGATYDLNTGYETPGWFSDHSNGNVTTVVFDESFNNARPTSTYSWFKDMGNLSSIVGMEYLNTSEVTNMAWMFSLCWGMETFDLSHFNTAKVTNMSYMFNYCEGMTSIDLSTFDTRSVLTMERMFNECSALSELNLSGFNTQNVTNFYEMFYDCVGLTSLDLSNFDTHNAQTMNGMFSDCSGLASIDLSSFNTQYVDNMNNMFSGCFSLTSLDLSSFNTDYLLNTEWMFSNCRALKTVYVGNGWDESNVENSDGMFFGCTSLVGGQGTAFDENHVDAAYAHIDGGTSNPGYFTNGVKFNPVMLPANENYIGLTSFRADWTDETTEAKVASYTLLVNPKIDEPMLLASLYGSWYTDGYADITLPAPWGGVNVRGGKGAIYVKNNYNGNARGYITYTIPESYINAKFSLLITTGSGAYGAGNYTVYTPQTAAVGHDFVAEETYTWLVTASSGEKITIYSTDSGASADIALMSVSAIDNAEGQLFSGITDKFYTVNNLEAGGTYQYRVKTLYTDGKESAWSNLEEVTLSENAQFLRGDVNGDSSVDITDATMLINYLLSGNASGLNLENANCDQQGGVDISDATALINYLLNGNWN
ncbi:MAG: BspA family leucine-rich repeat surface protein [Muribaculaceae bacterium]|nr:BspA family leucine-rich repeat surface protein [Muribaculaceae bacterium]